MAFNARNLPPTVQQIARTDTKETLIWAVQAAVAIVGLILLSPVLLLIAIAIKLSSPGPVLYCGKRVGRDESIFTIYKFRTLAQNAEQEIGARLLSDEDRERYSNRVGKFLKKSKLDELPQLLNVIRGEMRLVGPRPIRPIFLQELKQEVPNYAARFAVPPGLTGIAQLRGGYYTSPRNKHRYDVSYIKNRSALLDLKLIHFTFIKIVDAWLQMGLVVLFLFLFVTFVPASALSTLEVSIFGIEFNPLYLLIIAAVAYAIAGTEIARFRLQRSPLNWAIMLFLVLGLVSALASDDPVRTLRGTAYYTVTGFFVAFLIVNTLSMEAFLTLSMRVIALAPALLSLVGLGQLYMLNAATANAALDVTAIEFLKDQVRMTSILGNPMLLSVYLVLGVPLLLAEVTQAKTQTERDFWIVCATLSIVGIIFTQTRMGHIALLVTGTFFLARNWKSAAAFVIVFAVGLTLLLASGVPRFSPDRIQDDVSGWVEKNTPVLKAVQPHEWLVGGGSKTGDWLRAEGVKGRRVAEIENMHLTLTVEHGVGGWLTVMAVILSSLWMMKKAHDRLTDPRLQTLLWAIMSSIVGFLVSMNGINAFRNLSLQIFFWSLIGIGLAIVNHTRGRRGELIWRFGDAGD